MDKPLCTLENRRLEISGETYATKARENISTLIWNTLCLYCNKLVSSIRGRLVLTKWDYLRIIMKAELANYISNVL